MSRKVTKGQGTVLLVGSLDIDGELPGVNYDLQVGRITDIGGVTAEADEIEVTNNDSPKDTDASAWKEFTSGLADGGEVEITLQFHKSDAATVWGLFRKDKAFKVVFPDGPDLGRSSHWEFAGFIKKFGQEVEREKLVTTKLTIRVSGKPIFTAAT